jgi:hypothetical protein
MVPIRIKEDDEGVQVITDDSMTIEWNVRWFEMYDPVSRSWHDVVGLSRGEVVYGRAAENSIDFVPIRLWEFDPEREVVGAGTGGLTGRIHGALGLTGIEAAMRPIRLVDTRPSIIEHYEIHVVEYDIMSQEGPEDPYLAYMQRVLVNSAAWENIGMGTPREDTGGNRRNHEVRRAHDQPVSPLKSNTSYVIFFRPQNRVGPSYHPTYTTGTTHAVRPDLEPYPTVPILRVEREPITGITEGTNCAFRSC